MRIPPEVDWLDAWERCGASRPPRRAIALLEAACPDASAEELSRLPVGARDALLLRVRERLFGARFVATAECPACAERVELEQHVADLLLDPTEPVSAGAGVHRHVEGRVEVRFRLPDSSDLESIAHERDVEVARRALLARCVLEVREGGRSLEELPAAIEPGLVAAMERLDPQAELRFALSCPACGERWSTELDIASFLWSELDRWARRTLEEVHLLAHAYGWSEREILALGPARRAAYLELVRR